MLEPNGGPAGRIQNADPSKLPSLSAPAGFASNGKAGRLGTTGLPWKPAKLWDIEALRCVGRGFDEAAWGAASGLLSTIVATSINRCLCQNKGIPQAKNGEWPKEAGTCNNKKTI